MTVTVPALAAASADAPFERVQLERRDLRPDDVRIDIRWAGICHSDIHTKREEWGTAHFPLTPGHEILGTVVEVGDQVTTHQVGDVVGVGCFVDSCMECAPCKDGEEQYCLKGGIGTYGVEDYYGEVTQGGYSGQVVVRDHFVVKIPDSYTEADYAAVTPLLCAGITTYHPLKEHNVGPGTRVGVVGLGGLGHVAVKLAAAMGAEVSVFSRTDAKKEDGLSFGAKHYYATEDGSVFSDLAGSFDVIVNTVGANIGLDAYMGLLDRGGVLHDVGAPEENLSVSAFSLLVNRRSLAGSMIGGLPETQEMIDFAAEHGVTATVEVISADQVDEYYDKVVHGQVRYRAVIDTETL
ncbi:NAD(P)-dependent alcohol dehydrogenase [Nocardioides bruguierae]|uniref:NAD(P)-dependent alcohol dehydrogenase n=1 Tax=Nocardioides bruguierae TaxID=2945102 RepID=UPI002021A3CE|nr:NAD(P)-dependent alcohol dehydrogenase [Nocardioides bruguierae]MCL8023958.1 NAD(P)-dependent alcohol dehydrogenase [Nocardioides bruguierae]